MAARARSTTLERDEEESRKDGRVAGTRGRDVGGSKRGKRRNREREERNPPPYALTPSKGTTTHALLQARIHTLLPGLPSRALASRQIVLRRYTRTKERVDDRFSGRDSLDGEDGEGFL